MKISLLIILAFSSWTISCKNDPSKTALAEKIPVNVDTLQCYADTTNGDRIFLQLHVTGNNITGDMNYHISGKDRNQGSLQGEMKGDTLIADYSFLSEGIQSIRQVAFLKKDNSLVEGYGDVEEVHGKIQFKNIQGLSFGNGIVLEEIQCNE